MLKRNVSARQRRAWKSIHVIASPMSVEEQPDTKDHHRHLWVCSVSLRERRRVVGSIRHTSQRGGEEVCQALGSKGGHNHSMQDSSSTASHCFKHIALSIGDTNPHAPELLERRSNRFPHQPTIHRLFNDEPMGN